MGINVPDRNNSQIIKLRRITTFLRRGAVTKRTCFGCPRSIMYLLKFQRPHQASGDLRSPAASKLWEVAGSATMLPWSCLTITHPNLNRGWQLRATSSRNTHQIHYLSALIYGGRMRTFCKRRRWFDSSRLVMKLMTHLAGVPTGSRQLLESEPPNAPHGFP